MTVGENIKRARKEKGITQKELGIRLGGISQQQIGQWETGKARPKIETIQKIADALGIPSSELLPASFANAYIAMNPTLQESINKLAQVGISAINKNLENRGIDKIIDNYNKLNTSGKIEAQKRIEELTEIKKYTVQDN